MVLNTTLNWIFRLFTKKTKLSDIQKPQSERKALNDAYDRLFQEFPVCIKILRMMYDKYEVTIFSPLHEQIEVINLFIEKYTNDKQAFLDATEIDYAFYNYEIKHQSCAIENAFTKLLPSIEKDLKEFFPLGRRIVA